MALDTTYGNNGLGYNRCPGFPATRRYLSNRGTLAQVKTEHSDRYEIHVTSGNDIADIILGYLPFKVGDEFFNPNHNTDSPTLLTEINLSRNQTARLVWFADMKYEEAIAEFGTDNNTPPDQLLPEWSWGSETISKPIIYDVNGDFLGSSAGEPYGIEAPFAFPILSVERYEPFFDPSIIVDFVNHVNSAYFAGGYPGEVLCTGIEDRKDSHVVFGNQYYRKVRYIFKFAVPAVPEVIQGHDLILLDHGTFYLDSQGNHVHFKAGSSDTTGNLDGSGGKIADGSTWLFARQIFPSVNFNILGL